MAAVDLYGNEVEDLTPGDGTYRASLNREQTLPVLTAADYANRAPFTLATGDLFNYGSPGSPTEAINRNNPTADLSKPYVQKGDTGGYLVGTGITLGEGTSKTAAQAEADLAAARDAGFSDAEIQSFIARNGLRDSGRVIEALRSERAGGGGDGGSGGRSSGGGGGGSARTLPGNQFDDTYTSLLEDIAKSQMGEVRSNPALDQLLAFLTKRFTELSETPGYSPADLALLNTQAVEPIEELRRASQARELERTARAGYLPTSGLTLAQQRQIDTETDKVRAAAGRDLGINAINKRNADLSQALNLAQMRGLTIPGGQRSEELALSNILYQLPRTAMQDALSVINGSPSSGDALAQAIQLATANRYQDQISAGQNAALWGQIGTLLADLFRK